MKFEKITALLTAAILVSGTTAGAEVYKVSVNDNGVGEFSGSFPGMTGGRAALEILKPGKNITDDDAFVYAGETDVDGNGEFSDTFSINASSGKYLLRIGLGGTLFEKSFMFVNEKEMAEYLSRIKSAQSADEICDIFEENYGRLKFLCGVFVEPKDKEEVYSALYSRINSETVDSFSKIRELVAEIVLINDFLNAKENKEDALQKLFDYFDEKYVPVIALWKDTSVTSDLIKSTVISYLQGRSIISMSDMEREFSENAIWTMLSKVNSKGKELTVVTKAHELMGLTEYNKFASYSETKKISILSNIKSGYASVSEYAELFDRAVKNYKEPEKTTPSGGKSSTGGSGIVLVDTKTSDGESKPEDKPTAQTGFNDLDNFEWARSNIERLFDKKIINGKADGVFAPADNVTREEFVTMIINALSMRNNAAVCDNFTDVTKSDWFYIPIASAVEREIINGIEENLFGVGQNITRQDAAAITERAAKAAGVAFSDDEAQVSNEKVSYEYAVIKKDAFYDSDKISDYAKKAVEHVHSMEIINGYPDGEFKPEATMNRAEAAVITDKLMKFLDAQRDAASDSDKAYIEDLKTLGMYSGDDKQLSENITRGNGAALICDLMNIKSTGNAKSEFSDVSEDNENSGCIAELAARNILVGTDGKFNPDRELSYNDAVRAAVIAMGYEKAAELDGGELNSYLKIATENGYLTNVKSSDGKITKMNLLKLFGNLIDEEVMEYTFSDGNPEYSKSDKTYAEAYFGIKREKGKITANPFTGIGTDTKSAKGSIKIDGTEMKNPNSEYEKLIGRKVEYFYKGDDTDEYELVLIRTDKKTDVKTIKSPDIDSFSDMTYKYNTDGQSSLKSLKISKNTNIILNNQRIFDYTDSDLFPKSGEIEFVDFDGNGIYDENDTVIIKSYKNVVVNNVDSTREMIYDKYTDYSDSDAEDYSVNLKNIDEYKILDKYGDEYGLNELREWDVLAVMMTPDKDYAEITLVDECIGGTLEGVYMQDGERCFKIGGKLYPISEDFRGKLDDFKIGNEVTLYWDLYGKVTAIENGIASYAEKSEGKTQTNELTNKLVIVSGYKIDRDDTEKCYLKTYYTDQKISTTPLVEKVKINGNKCKSLEAESLLDTMLGKVVKLGINENNEIAEIITAAAPGEDENRGLWILNYPNENLRYGSEANAFGKRFFRSNSTIYTIPKSASDYGNQDLYAVNTATFANESYYLLDGYTTDLTSKRAEVIVYKADPIKGGQIEAGSGFVIGNIETALNADDEPVIVLEGIDYLSKSSYGTAKTLELSKDVMFIDFYNKELTNITADDLEPGDCIRYGANNGVVETIQLTYDYSEDSVIYNDGTKSNRSYAGDVYDVSADGKYLTIVSGKRAWEIDEKSADSSQYLQSYWIRTSDMYTIVDKTGKNTVVKKGTEADIQSYKKAGKFCSKVVLFSEWAETIYAVVVYVE